MLIFEHKNMLRMLSQNIQNAISMPQECYQKTSRMLRISRMLSENNQNAIKMLQECLKLKNATRKQPECYQKTSRMLKNSMLSECLDNA